MANDSMLVHHVVFSLRDKSPKGKQAFIAALRELLREQSTAVYSAAGELADDIAWSVSDRDFDVAVLIVFPDKATHDAYQDSPPHLRFMDRHEADWTSLRAIDWYVKK